jgi:hypothetical protein
MAERDISLAALNPARGPADQEDRRIDSWLRALPWYKEFAKNYGGPPSLDPTGDYNYVQAYRAGIEPERYKYDKNRYHWPSGTDQGVALKSENHPTMWAQHFMEQTNVDPYSIGIRDPAAAQVYLMQKYDRGPR